MRSASGISTTETGAELRVYRIAVRSECFKTREIGCEIFWGRRTLRRSLLIASIKAGRIYQVAARWRILLILRLAQKEIETWKWRELRDQQRGLNQLGKIDILGSATFVSPAGRLIICLACNFRV